MINKKELEAIQAFAKSQLDTQENRIMYAVVETNKIVWQAAVANFKLDEYSVGSIIENREILTTIKNNQEKSLNFYHSSIKKNLNIKFIPIVDEENALTESSFLTIQLKVHPLERAFKSIAPIITELFPEGAFISLTNTEEIINVQRSEKYDIPVVEPGFNITQEAGIQAAIKTGKINRADDDSLTYGPPVRVVTAPYFEEYSKEVVGVINIIRPKQAELSLKEMSGNLERQLSDLSVTIQELAIASTSIHANEQEVNNQIEEITSLAHQIFEVSNIIKSIADSTKMLGLNASIEAARAGAAGKGFSVVATEINKLSEQSKNTVPKIKKLTDDIKAKVEEAKDKSKNSLMVSQDQVASTEEITATIEEIQAVSVILANIANTI
jgi:hypothetical protein